MQMSVPIPYFEAQGPEGNHCGMHAINMHAGGDVFSKQSMVAAADGLRTEFERRGIPFVREEHITHNGDYSVELLMRVAELDYLTKREREALVTNPTGTSCLIRHEKYHISAVKCGYLCDPQLASPVLLTLRAWFICAMTLWPF